MTKKIFSIALVAMSLGLTPAFAQSASDNQKKCEQTECKKDKKDCKNKKECKGDKKCKDSKEVRQAQLLKGMTLTDAQKDQLKALNEKTAKERKEMKKAAKAEKKQQKEMNKETRKALKEKKEAQKRAYLQDVKQIVGNDNYVIFLENQFIMKSDASKSAKHPQDMKKGKMKGVKLQNGAKDGKFKEAARIDKAGKSHKPFKKGRTVTASKTA